MASSLPPFPPFKIREDELSAGTSWKNWITKYENLVIAMDITADQRKKALLIYYGGDKVYDLVETFSEESRESYETHKAELSNYFTPKVNPTFESFKLRKTKQETSENVDQFHVRLRTQASLCHFENIEREILAQLIEGVTSSKLRRKALRDRLSLTQFLAEARNDELTEKQTKEIENSVDQLQALAIRQSHKSHGKKHRMLLPNKNPNKDKPQQTHKKTQCRNCGGLFPHTPHKPCPAKGKTCNNCHKPNRFAKVCRSFKAKAALYAIEDIGENSDSEGVFTLHTHTHRKRVPKTTVRINNHPFEVIIDTGASVNIITTSTYDGIVPRPKLELSSTPIYGYNTTKILTNQRIFYSASPSQTGTGKCQVLRGRQNK